MKNLFVKLACIPALLFFAGFCHAADGEWEYLFAPYLWGAGLDGTVGARGLQVEVDASFGDIFDHLQIGGQGHFEASNVNGSYSRISRVSVWELHLQQQSSMQTNGL